uniref:Carboxylic ester hydrolase n=1 Tax=Cacopsylla melanoneura TaxID=428564 RepID=A0A8D9AVP2_9HEMI
MNTVVLFLCCVSTAWAAVVNIKQGSLEGNELESRGGKTFHAFQGIPFAKPPTGDLRYRNPEPDPGWEGVFDATKEADICVQEIILIKDFAGIPLGNEDCLYLNVYTPDPTPGKKLPVMVWIYGGAFQMGGADSRSCGPSYIMDRDVVYVNFNYRVGSFGFLSFEDPTLAGNFGMKDQQLAMQWVKENIAAFGGDPDSITLFGNSAGSCSVHYHLVAPGSQGLFHRAIMQSGAAWCPWAIIPPGQPKVRAQAFATLVGCYGDVEQVAKCLREVPSAVLLQAQLKFMEWGVSPMVNFAPVIEPDHAGAFISKHPIDYKSSDVPLIIGVNRDEGALFTAEMCADDMMYVKELNEGWDRYMPMSVLHNSIVDKEHTVPQVIDALSNYYLGGHKTVDADNIYNLTTLFSDILFNECVYKAAVHHPGPVYFYVYSYEGEVSWASLFGGDCPLKLGVSHADEMINEFDYETLFGIVLGGKDLEMSQTFLAVWTNFAATGTPTDDAGKIKWTRFDSSPNQDYLDFGKSEITMKQMPFGDRLKFIESLPLENKIN